MNPFLEIVEKLDRIEALLRESQSVSPLNGQLDAQEAASYCRVSRSKMYELAQSGKVPCKRVGDKYIFFRDGLDKWLREEE